MHRVEPFLRVSNWRVRRHRRFNLEFPILLKVHASDMPAEIETVSKNISVGGLLVRSTQRIPQHTPVAFVLSVHGERAVRPIHLVGEGEVVRVESEGDNATYSLAVKCNSPVTQLEDYLG